MPVEVIVHPLALVEPGAELGEGVRIGPFCHVGPEARIGDRTELGSHVAIMGATTLGPDCRVSPHAVLGAPPQNGKHKGGPSTLSIGANCTIREFVTMHRGTDTSLAATTVGDNGNFLAYVHIAHDCTVGDNATFANGATLGGHCEIGDNVGIGGLTAVHQFVRVGDGAFLGGCSAVISDVIPYGMASGNRATLRGFNVVGLRRAGVGASEMAELRRFYGRLFDRSRTLAENLEAVQAERESLPRHARSILDFLSARDKRNITLPSVRGGTSAEEH